MMIGDRAFYTLYDVASRRENSESDRGKLFARVRLLIARVRRVDGAVSTRADSSKWVDERGRLAPYPIADGVEAKRGQWGCD